MATEGKWFTNAVSVSKPDMSRRSLLSADQRARLFATPVVEAGLTRHYVLSSADFSLIRTKRRASNRLGFCDPNSLRRAVFFHRQGETPDRTFENKSFRACGLSLLAVQGAREALAIAKGEADLTSFVVRPSSEVNVKAIRTGLHMSRATFAETFKLSVRTLPEWEHGRAKPDATGRAYLKIIQARPEAVKEALALSWMQPAAACSSRAEIAVAQSCGTPRLLPFTARAGPPWRSGSPPRRPVRAPRPC